MILNDHVTSNLPDKANSFLVEIVQWQLITEKNFFNVNSSTYHFYDLADSW